MVVRNDYIGSYNSLTSENITISGLTSETSTTNVSIIKELSTKFFDSVYETIIDAGYSDAVKNETEYSITVLGFKFYVVVDTSWYPCIYATPIGSNISYTRNSIAKRINNTQYDYMYNIIVRGDSNIITISYEPYDYYGEEETRLFFIAKAKNLITGENAYYFGSEMKVSNSTYYSYIINKEHNYTYYYNSPTLLEDDYNYSGLNTKNKYVCAPMLAFYGTFLIYSMIRGNKAIFTKGKYYKIGNDIYYCNNSNYICPLYKVEWF